MSTQPILIQTAIGQAEVTAYSAIQIRFRDALVNGVRYGYISAEVRDDGDIRIYSMYRWKDGRIAEASDAAKRRVREVCAVAAEKVRTERQADVRAHKIDNARVGLLAARESVERAAEELAKRLRVVRAAEEELIALGGEVPPESVPNLDSVPRTLATLERQSAKDFAGAAHATRFLLADMTGRDDLGQVFFKWGNWHASQVR